MSDNKKYDNYASCNKCGGDNSVEVKDSIANNICECETVCKVCGFVDYWGYGFFESQQDGYNKSEKY